MKTFFFAVVLSVLVIALIVTVLIRQEQQSMYRLKDVCIRLMQKFDSWQMMRWAYFPHSLFRIFYLLDHWSINPYTYENRLTIQTGMSVHCFHGVDGTFCAQIFSKSTCCARAFCPLEFTGAPGITLWQEKLKRKIRFMRRIFLFLLHYLTILMDYPRILLNSRKDSFILVQAVWYWLLQWKAFVINSPFCNTLLSMY